MSDRKRMSDLAALLAHIEAADEGNGVLNADISDALDVWWIEPAPESEFDGVRAGPWTHSLDAAIALRERVLPGWDWSLETSETMVNGRVFRASDASLVGPDRNCSGQGNSPALALCAAVVKAKMEEKP